MSITVTPIKNGLKVPPGHILVNDKWKGSAFEKCLSGLIYN